MRSLLLAAAAAIPITVLSAVSAEDVALAKRAVDAITLADMSLLTAVRQGDKADFQRFIVKPVDAQLGAILALPQAKRIELLSCITAGTEFLNRADDSMKARKVLSAGGLENEAIKGCKEVRF